MDKPPGMAGLGNFMCAERRAGATLLGDVYSWKF